MSNFAASLLNAGFFFFLTFRISAFSKLPLLYLDKPARGTSSFANQPHYGGHLSERSADVWNSPGCSLENETERWRLTVQTFSIALAESWGDVWGGGWYFLPTVTSFSWW